MHRRTLRFNIISSLQHIRKEAEMKLSEKNVNGEDVTIEASESTRLPTHFLLPNVHIHSSLTTKGVDSEKKSSFALALHFLLRLTRERLFFLLENNSPVL